MAAAACAAVAGPFCGALSAQESPAKSLGTVTVTGGMPTSLPTQVPASMEGITRDELRQQINATDAGDALKYLPSLNVRKRYIGDYDHAVLASRASGTGNSARSLVYADGIPLHNLLGNGAFYTPRWGLVSPEEIERADVMYGPFSAAYPGNSVGAVVDYVTRMPQRFEAHASVGAFSQGFGLYGTRDRYQGHQASASVGSKVGNFSYWLFVSRLDSDGQPLVFANKLVSTGSASAAGTPVSGAIVEANPRQQPWVILGATNLAETTQDQAKAKLQWDITPTLRANATLGTWHNEAFRGAQTYLRDANGQAVWAGPVRIDGRTYTLQPSDFSVRREVLTHSVAALSLQTRTQGHFDGSAQMAQYRYGTDQVRASSTAAPAGFDGGAGNLTTLDGSGWTSVHLRGTWRPEGHLASTHTLDFGLQHDRAQLQQERLGLADWVSGSPLTRQAFSGGRSQTTAIYAQDHWRISPLWRATLGLRAERWQASDGVAQGTGAAVNYARRSQSAASPKLALAHQINDAWAIKAALGRAVRWPTVAELYQSMGSLGSTVNNDPNLRPEKSWTGELSAERSLGTGPSDQEADGSLRLTLFAERTRDALYSQTDVATNITNVQNVDRIRTRGAEVVWQQREVGRWLGGIKGLSASASLTYAHSLIVANARQPASVGKRQPRVPDWRATTVVTYQANQALSFSAGMRHSGRQFNQLDNSDTNENAYQSVSRYTVTDLRMTWRINPTWQAALGIDNLGNRTYWAFHPYPQRTAFVQLRAAL